MARTSGLFAGTAHDHLAERCRDDDCPRLPCRLYKAGYECGLEEGHGAGYAAGYGAGYSAGESATVPGRATNILRAP
jgi:hypothetical protein